MVIDFWQKRVAREAPQCLRGRQYILIEATGREGSCVLPVLLIFQNILSSKQARGGKRRKEGGGKGTAQERERQGVFVIDVKPKMFLTKTFLSHKCNV